VIYRGVKVGKNFFAHSHVSIRENCEIGDNVILHNGVVIGSDGFGFAKRRWKLYKIPQTDACGLKNQVEIQANSCIDRASLGETRIGRNTKIDNLTHVAHNCVVAENSMLCAQVGLAGSTEVGKNVILAGQVGVAGHCKIGRWRDCDRAERHSRDIPAGSMVSGSPAFDHKQWLRSVTAFVKLPELARAVRSKAPRNNDRRPHGKETGSRCSCSTIARTTLFCAPPFCAAMVMRPSARPQWKRLKLI